MVKKIFLLLAAGAFILTGVMAGCDKAAHPVVPAGSAVLNLVIPSKILNAPAPAKFIKGSSKASVPNSNGGAFEYYLSMDGEAPVTGVISFASGSQVGSVFINLPKAGNWLVAGEWFYVYNPSLGSPKPLAKLVLPGGLSAIPEFAGADRVNVQGTTSFTLNMEDIGYQEYTCYQANLTDATNCDFNLGGSVTTYSGSWEDLYSFDSGAVTASIFSGTGDLQALYDVTTLSTYLAAPTFLGAGPPPPAATFTYLGNGDLVNFPLVPAGAVYYSNTLLAKAAAVGSAAATLAGGDIFVVTIPSTNAVAWVQVNAPSYDCASPPSSSLLSFVFIYNNEGLNYMKFDETANGRINCNLNPTPTPTPTPVVPTPTPGG
jgi:hypothetical protein